MNRVFVAGIAGLAMLMFASVDAQAGFGKCGGRSGGLFSGLGASRCGGAPAVETCPPVDACGGRAKRERGCGGGLFAKLAAKRAAKCCGEPAPVCCEPAPVATCCEPAPVATCCEPAPVATCGGCAAPVSDCGCAAPVASCGGCAAPVSDCGCGSTMMSAPMMSGTIMGAPVMMGTPGCANCSTTMDSGMIIESAAPSMAPPAPTPDAVPDAAPPAPAPEA